MRLGGFLLVLVLGVAAGATVALLTAAGVDDGQAVAAPAQPQPQGHTLPETPLCNPAPLEERVGQVLVVGLPHTYEPDDDLAREVIEVGVAGVFVTQANVRSAEQVRELTATLSARSTFPLLVATDEEMGRVSSFRALFGATSAPRTLAARIDADELEARATELGRYLAELGVNLDFAPVADLDDGPAGSLIGDRSFSADPQVASAYALAFSRGLMTGGVVPTVKHFPGHGRSAEDTHSKLAEDHTPLAELMDTDLVPFMDQIAAGVPVVMVGHVTHTGIDPDYPSSMSAETYQLLRELGFRGVAVTDSVGMGAVHRRWKFAESSVKAIGAGADLVLATDGHQAGVMHEAIMTAVEDGTLPEERLNEAVARVLTLKGVDPEPVACTRAEGFPSMQTAAANVR